ncbi:MAG: hypothetical protein V3G42_11650 [Oscillospiraceae bacterium]
MRVKATLPSQSQRTAKPTAHGHYSRLGSDAVRNADVTNAVT